MITPEAQRRYMYDAKFHAVAHTFAMVMEQGNTTTEDATLALEVALSLVAHWRWERPGATKPDPIPGAPMPKGYAEATGRTIAHDGSGIGMTVVADETVELCHAKDPHSPRVCMRAKGHEGEHAEPGPGGILVGFPRLERDPRDHRTAECQHGVSAICERCRGQWHVMGNRK